MKYLNVSVTGLRGKKHPALYGIFTTHEVKKSRIHLKMLSGDYLTFEKKARRSGGSPHCRSCLETPAKNESFTHILTECNAYTDIRERIFPEYYEACRTTKSKLNFLDICENDNTLTQFILDPSSLNLKNRVHMSDEALHTLFKISRDYCFTINSRRMRKISGKET